MTSTCCEHGCRDRAPTRNEAAIAHVQARLAQPARCVALEEALRDFLYTDIVAEARLPPLFEDPPDLPDRLRGALGRSLEAVAARESVALFGSPPAWDVLFDAPVGAPGLDPLRPFVIRVDRRGFDLMATLRLFGFADCWLSDAMAAFAQALDGGIAIRGRSGHRVRLAVRDVRVERHWGIPVDPDARQVRLRLDTPLVLRSGRRAAPGIARLAPAMGRRLAALCRWQDSALALAAPVGLAKVLCDDLSPVTWLRFSSSQRRGQPIRALIGAATLGGLTAEGGMLLQAAAVLHAGASCPSGHGRISVFNL